MSSITIKNRENNNTCRYTRASPSPVPLTGTREPVQSSFKISVCGGCALPLSLLSCIVLPDSPQFLLWCWNRVVERTRGTHQIRIKAHSNLITHAKFLYNLVTILYLFYIKRWFTNQFLFHFQTKDSDTHAYAHSWSPGDGDRNQQNNELLGPFRL